MCSKIMGADEPLFSEIVISHEVSTFVLSCAFGGESGVIS